MNRLRHGDQTWILAVAMLAICLTVTSAPADAGDPDVIFIDGVDEGHVGAWSSSVPSAGVIELISDNFSASEGQLKLVKVFRVGGYLGTVSVDITVSGGTATPDVDFTPIADTLTWPDGDTSSKDVLIDVLDDNDPEPNETVDIALDNPIGAPMGDPNAAVLTILDTD